MACMLAEIKKTLFDFLVEKANEAFEVEVVYNFYATPRDEYVFPYVVVMPATETRDRFVNASQRKHYTYNIFYIQRRVKPAGNEITDELFEKTGQFEAMMDGKIFTFEIEGENLSVKSWVNNVEYAQPSIVGSHVEYGVRMVVEFDFVVSLPCS